jgi:hypothetical protein
MGTVFGMGVSYMNGGVDFAGVYNLLRFVKRSVLLFAGGHVNLTWVYLVLWGRVCFGSLAAKSGDSLQRFLLLICLYKTIYYLLLGTV